MGVHEQDTRIARALLQALAGDWTRRHGAATAVEDADATTRTGWLVTLCPDDGRGGALIVWFDEVAAASWVRRALNVGADPEDAQIADELKSTVLRSAKALGNEAALAGITWAVPEITASAQPADAITGVLAQDDGERLPVAVLADVREAVAAARDEDTDAPTSAIPAGHSRLRTVLDVDLPLVVRFGRAMLPLRTVSELGPGAVIDMGRSPDEPVELLVGERVIARGEVVVVGGNYGVRITELTEGQTSVAPTMEANAV